MKIVAYARVSTDKQGASLGDQRAAIERWSAEHGHELVAVHEDFGISGAAALEDRPGLLAAIGALPRGGALVATKRDRIGRDPIVTAMIERGAMRRGASVVTVDGLGAGVGPEAILFRRVLDGFYEFERLIIGARTTGALDAKRSRGERTGQIPYGFALAPDRVHLVKRDDEQAVIKRVRRLRGRGLSLRVIASQLKALRLTTRSGGGWTHHDVRRVLDPDRAREEARRHRKPRLGRGPTT